jgi:hypothetical protein
MVARRALMSDPRSTDSAAEITPDKPGFRTKSLGTRLTPEELREVETAAERDGKKPAEWVREAVLRAARPSPEVPTELLLEELAALRYIVLNVFEATAQASEKGQPLATGSVARISEAADNRKRAKAQKLLAEFRSGGGEGRPG